VDAQAERDEGTFGFVAAAGGGGVSAGLVVVIATVLTVDALRPPDQSDRTLLLYLLAGGTIAGILVAAAIAWILLEPVQSTYRRGGLAMVAGFATAVVMLVCIPVYQLLGQAGLAGLLVLSAGVSILSWRRARRVVRA
jgi:hypothetical protein